MSSSRPFQWYHSEADPIWPDGTFEQQRFITERNCPDIPRYTYLVRFRVYHSIRFQITYWYLYAVHTLLRIRIRIRIHRLETKERHRIVYRNPAGNYPQIGPIYKNSLDWSSSQKNSCSVPYLLNSQLNFWPPGNFAMFYFTIGFRKDVV